MTVDVLSRYLDPIVLTHLEGKRFDPRGLVSGHLAGRHRSPAHGFAVEFAGHREYVPGDETKHIDWRLWFTRGKYFVKQYEMESNLTCHLALDVSSSMRYGTGTSEKVRAGARLLMCLGHGMLRQGDRISFTTFDDRVREHVPPGQSMAQILRISQLLDAVAPSEKTSLEQSLVELSARTGGREVILIASDLLGDLDGLSEGLGRLRFGGREVVVFHTLHGDELRFELEGRCRFVGLEGQNDLTLEAADLRLDYIDALHRYEERVEAICRAHHVERVVVDTGRDLASVLAAYLDERQRRIARGP